MLLNMFSHSDRKVGAMLLEDHLVASLRAALALAYRLEDARQRSIVVRYIEDAILRLGSDL